MLTKWAKRYQLFIISIVFLIGLSTWVYLIRTHWFQKQVADTPDSGLRCLSPQNNLCGPKALFISLSRIGYPLRSSELENELQPIKNGVSFRNLKETAHRKGFEAYLAKLTWQELLNLNTTAVLWVNENHFIAVDPRENSTLDSKSTKKVRVYEPDIPAQFWTQEQIERVWGGETLIIKRKPVSVAKSDGPCIDWDKCLQDCGFLDHNIPAEYTFDFRNIGDKPLSVKIANIGCKCSNAKLSNNELQTGQSGQLEVGVNLRGKRGFFSSHIAIESNDPKQPISFLFVRGNAQNNNLTSTRILHFGHIPQGQSTTKSFLVYDTSENKLQIRNARITWSAKDNIAPLLTAKVQFNRVGKDANKLLGNGKLKSSDYLVTVDIYPDPNCPVGEFFGCLLLSTNLSGNLKHVRVDVKGAIIGDVVAKPKALLLMLKKDDYLHAEIKLTSLSGKSINLVDTVTEGNISIKKIDVIKVDDHVLAKTYFDKPETKNCTACGDLLFYTGGKSVVKVPVIIYNNHK